MPSRRIMTTFRLSARPMFCLLVVLGTCLAAVPTAEGDDQNFAEREQKFAKLLSGATLAGRFTDSAAGDDAPLKQDRYTFGEVRKLRDNLWQFQTRIQYGDRDVTVPLTLPVEWAGDTPVIVVDNVGIPGLGVYSARVMFHGDRYAGFWQGANHGGHMFGTIQRPHAEPSTDQLPEDHGDSQRNEVPGE